MGSTVQNYLESRGRMPSQTWHWFMNLNSEEWMVALVAVCAFGFVCLLGFQSRRI